MTEFLELRIHHFFDTIRDLGAGKDLQPHPYGHSLHKVAALIRKDPQIKIRLVTNCQRFGLEINTGN